MIYQELIDDQVTPSSKAGQEECCIKEDIRWTNKPPPLFHGFSVTDLNLKSINCSLERLLLCQLSWDEVQMMSPDCKCTQDFFDKLAQQLEKMSSVDFELPEWLKKRKSLPYSFIKRNVYLIKRVKKRIEDDGIFCSCSDVSDHSKVCGRDCQCGLLLSSCSTSCKCGDSCLNKPFQQRPIKKMKLIKTDKCGLGLVADEDIKRGEFVIEYVGEVIDDKTCEERLWEMKRRGETNFYLCEINRDMVIDATYKGNKSRFINHSCQPNTEMQKWRIDGETRIGIFAIRDINKGEDMTYDYRFVQFGADQDCHCGALGCRQKLGIKPTKPKMFPESLFAADLPAGGLGNGRVPYGHSCLRQFCTKSCIGQYVQILQPLEDRCYVGCIFDYDSSTRKHSIMLENRRQVVLDMGKEIWNFL